MTGKMRILGLAALIGAVSPVNVTAADLSCTDITFTPAAKATYEAIDKACLEMVDRDGETYARLSASVIAQTRSGTHVRFLFRDGNRGPSHKAQFPPDFEIMLNGMPVSLNDLAIRREINIYISDKYWSVSEAAPASGAVDESP